MISTIFLPSLVIFISLPVYSLPKEEEGSLASLPSLFSPLFFASPPIVCVERRLASTFFRSHSLSNDRSYLLFLGLDAGRYERRSERIKATHSLNHGLYGIFTIQRHSFKLQALTALLLYLS